MNLTKLENVQGYETALNNIRTSEAAIRDAVNEWAPLGISGVHAGDNIAQVNNLINAFDGIRRSRIVAIVKRFLPYTFDTDMDVFTKKDTKEPVIKRKTDAYLAFLDSGETFWSLVDEVKKADKKPVDLVKLLTKATAKAVEGGMTIEGIIAIVQAAAAAQAAAELLAAPIPALANVG
jgi:hypothetical protein